MARSITSKAAIKDIAAMVRSELLDGTLYGERIDMNDRDEVMAAAWLLGRKMEKEYRDARKKGYDNGHD